MSTITLLGASYATLQTASNMNLASEVRVTNLHSTELTLTVASVGTTKPTFPGTVVIESGQAVNIKKGPTDTIAGGTAGQLVATAIMVGG
tara:strand:+ start:91 stop:360 length:270 start_codon:yes stop_codon:yes gene_type:complete